MFAFLALTGCLVHTERYEERREELTDHDGDGFLQKDDCDDRDPTIFPGADELCDGKNQDCDEEIDEDALDAPTWYPDGDSDTFGDSRHAGTTDCAGRGVANSLDCDDTTALVNPLAVEIPYDGIDNDCNGGDLIDVDGDGWAGAAVEGHDCDDRDATRHPTAVETWDDGFTDNDCDGLSGSATLEFGANAWSGWQAGDHQGRRTAGLGDLDGDGLADVLVGSEYDSTVGESSGGVYALDGAPGGSLTVARSLLPEASGLVFASDVDSGVDATGDGIADLLISSVGSSDTAGKAWIVDGAAWVAAGDASIGEVDAGLVTGSAAGTYGPTSVRFVGDVTGDGVADIALGECCGTAAGLNSRGRIALFSADAFTGSTEDAEVMIDGPWDGTHLGGNIDALGDQDGDGLDDLLLSGQGGLAAAVVGGNHSGSLADLAITLVYGDVSGGYANALNTGDLDGDGRDDIAILGEDEGRLLYFFTAVAAAPTRVLDMPSCVFNWSDPGGVRSLVRLGDRDGDGLEELFIAQFYSGSGNQRAWILPGSSVNFGGSIDSSALALSAVSVVPTAQFGYSAAFAGDVDGDGQDDLVIGAPDYSATGAEAGGATLIPVPE